MTSVTAAVKIRAGNLYYCLGDPVWVYPPAHTKPFYKISHHARSHEVGAQFFCGRRRLRRARFRPERTRTVKEGINRPHALAFDPSGNVYVANTDSVTVYSPGGTKLLRTIREGVRIAGSMTIGSP